MVDIFSDRSHLPEPSVLKQTMPAVVQVVALNKGFFGGTSAAWTGSGTIIDPKGIILTNCHVADPRSMGMPSPRANQLGIALTERSDEPPALSYIAEVVVISPELDLAVLRIVSDLNGKSTRGLKLPHIPVGDSDKLELADTMAIFGYPGIGGDTITFTSGSVAGFTKQEGIKTRRAWIKTDATIAGGNSGGTAIDHDGRLVGVPTQAAAGTGITPVDARPVVDTNQDGRIDHRDTPMAIGGFINGLRPINLAKPLLSKAGVKGTGTGSRLKVPMAPGPPPPPKKSKSQSRSSSRSKTKSKRRSTVKPAFSNLAFSERVTRDGRPINPTEILPSGVKQINVTFDFEGMRKGKKWTQVWAHNGNPVLNSEEKWDAGGNGRKTMVISNDVGMPDGEYRLILSVGSEILAEGIATVGRRVDDTDTEISGQVIDEGSGRAVGNALVIALKPGVRVMDFVQMQSQKMAYTSAKTNGKGAFTFPKQLFKGQAYGLVVIARGYQDLVVEGALRISPMAPEQAQIPPIALRRE